MIFTNIMGMVMSMNIPLWIMDLGFLKLGIVVQQLLSSRDVSAPGLSFKILDCKCYQWTPLCKICILN